MFWFGVFLARPEWRRGWVLEISLEFLLGVGNFQWVVTSLKFWRFSVTMVGHFWWQLFLSYSSFFMISCRSEQTEPKKKKEGRLRYRRRTCNGRDKLIVYLLVWVI
jgi:hypothetical protein